jgi:hypothetical protein
MACYVVAETFHRTFAQYELFAVEMEAVEPVTVKNVARGVVAEVAGTDSTRSLTFMPTLPSAGGM